MVQGEPTHGKEYQSFDIEENWIPLEQTRGLSRFKRQLNPAMKAGMNVKRGIDGGAKPSTET